MVSIILRELYFIALLAFNSSQLTKLVYYNSDFIQQKICVKLYG